MKPALVGVIPRNGQPATSSGGNIYTPYLGGWVVKGTLGDGSAVCWSELQTTYAQNVAGTLVANNPIDQAITGITAYNSANGTSYGLKLRIHAGWRSPVWAGGDNGSLGTGTAPVGLDGQPSFPVKDPQFNDGGWCPPFWLPNFLAAYARLEAALIAKYDTCPVLLEVLLSSQMTIYNEPFLRQILSSTQVAAMRTAGFYAEPLGVQRQVVDAVLNGTATVTSATASFVNSAYPTGDIGSLVCGPGIPYGAYIKTWNSSSSVALSVSATASASGQTMTIMGTGTVSDQYLQLIDMSQRVGQGQFGAGGWLQTRVAYDYNPYQAILAGSTPSDPVTGGTVSGTTSFTKIHMLHALAMCGVSQFSAENSSYRVSYLSGNGAYQNMYAFMGQLGTINGIQVAATTANIDSGGGSPTGRLGGQTTLANIVKSSNGANGLAQSIAGAMLYVNAGHVELPEGWWPGGNTNFDTTPADIGVLTGLAPTASTSGGSGTFRQNLVPSATSASATSLAITSAATLAGSTLSLIILTRGASASTISSITGATFTLRKSQVLATSVDFGLMAIYDCAGAAALAANALAVNFAPIGSCAVLFTEMTGSGIAYEGGNITLGATTSITESYTTTHAGDFVLGAFGFDNSTFTISALTTAFTNATLLRGIAPSLGCSLQGGTDIPPATGSMTYSATVSAGIQWACGVVAYSVTGGSVPGTPTGVSGTPGNTNAVVSFTAPYNGGSVITSTLVKTYLAGVHQAGLDKTITGTGTSTTVTGLTNGTAYQSSATCTNANGAGPESALSAAYTPVAAATVPSTMAAPIGNPLNNEIDWTWVAPNNGGAAITSYTITETVVGGGSLTPVVINDGPPPSTVYDDTTNVSNGVAYTATITATNSVGTSAASPASAPYQPSAPPVTSTVTTNYPPAAHPAISARYAALLNGQGD